MDLEQIHLWLFSHSSAYNEKNNGGFMFDTSEFWHSPTKSELHVNIKAAKKPSAKNPKAVIHINHGLAEHAARYGRFADTLTKAGFAVYAQDHRGHGQTIAPDAPHGIFAKHNGWDKVLADMHFVNHEIKKRHTDTPIILFGHSMGAMLAYNYLLRWPESIDAAAIWNADLSKSPSLALLGLVLGAEKLFKGAGGESMVASLTFDAFNKKFKPNVTDFDWLSKDIEECRAYADDELCGWRPSVSMWQDLRSGIIAAAQGKGLEKVPQNMPINILGGLSDPSTRFGKAQQELADRLRKAGFTDIELTLRPDGRHEALNEPPAERNQVMDDFIGWAERTVSNPA